jgi:hypothetical protein
VCARRCMGRAWKIKCGLANVNLLAVSRITRHGDTLATDTAVLPRSPSENILIPNEQQQLLQQKLLPPSCARLVPIPLPLLGPVLSYPFTESLQARREVGAGMLYL